MSEAPFRVVDDEETILKALDFPTPDVLSDDALLAEIHALVEADKKSARRWACDLPDCDGDPHPGWLHRHARASQRKPPGWWTEWLMMTGRGWGKTRTAAETIWEWAKTPNTQIAVLAKKETLVREICFEHRRSGLVTKVIPPEEIVVYNRSAGAIKVVLRNGSVIYGFGAEVPDNIRGWEFDKAWCDEYAAWTRQTAQDTYDQLWFCMREAREPQVIITTTPKPLPHIKKLVTKHDGQVARAVENEQDTTLVSTRITKGHTAENRANLSVVALEELETNYAGRRLGRQELSGELLEDVEGALWQAWMFEVADFRLEPHLLPYMDRKVVAVDPAVTSSEDADYTAFTVAGRSYAYDATFADGLPRGYVLDSQQHRETPRRAMQRAAALYHAHQADAVVVEANNGGEYLRTVLNMVDPTVNVVMVNASRDKRGRAAPVAALYEHARIHHVGPAPRFAEVEDQMLTYVGIGDNGLAEKSPDLLDSLVWAMFHLFLDPSVPRPDMQTSDDRLAGRR